MARGVITVAVVLLIGGLVAACIRVGEPLEVVAVVGDRVLSASLLNRQIAPFEPQQQPVSNQLPVDQFSELEDWLRQQK